MIENIQGIVMIQTNLDTTMYGNAIWRQGIFCIDFMDLTFQVHDDKTHMTHSDSELHPEL